jgi:hypothetical protein
MANPLSKFGLVILLIFMAGRNYAQEHFILIQADSSQSFYVRMGSQLYSSSDGGHLILPHLKDSSYIVTVGLAGQSSSEQHFSFDIHQKDQIFRLKSVDGTRWGLYDRQGQELKIIDMGENGNRKPQIAGVKKDDAFSRLMADVVKDTAVMYSTYAMQQLSGDSVANLVAKAPAGADSAGKSRDTAVGTTRGAAVAATRGAAVAATRGTAVAASRDTVVATARGAGVGSTRGTAVAASRDSAAVIAVVPVDVRGTAVGTARGKVIVSALVNKDSAAPNSAAPVTAVPRYNSPGVVKVSEHKSSRSLRLVYADHGTDSKPDTIVVIIPVDTGRQAVSIPFVNSDCHIYATDYDVDKLRVKMLELVKDQDRIQTARKYFKTKCFSTHQIRALSEVFSTDAAKFNFLETAYPFVSDDRFSELVNLFSDPVYSGRFRKMTDRQ